MVRVSDIYPILFDHWWAVQSPQVPNLIRFRGLREVAAIPHRHIPRQNIVNKQDKPFPRKDDEYLFKLLKELRDFPMESQNYIGPQVPKKVSLNEKFKSRFKCKNCSFSGRTLTLGGHLAEERNSSCRLFYMRELEEEKLKKAPELAFMEEVASDPASAEPSANSQSTDAAELSMLVPEVKIRLAKERPFRQVCSHQPRCKDETFGKRMTTKQNPFRKFSE